MVRAGRRCRERGEKGDDAGGEHLWNTCSTLHMTTRAGPGVTHHTKLSAHFVGEIAEGEHTDDGAGERDTADGGAVVVSGNSFGTIHPLEHWKKQGRDASIDM